MEFATCAGYRVLTEGTGLLKKKDLERIFEESGWKLKKELMEIYKK